MVVLVVSGGGGVVAEQRIWRQGRDGGWLLVPARRIDLGASESWTRDFELQISCEVGDGERPFHLSKLFSTVFGLGESRPRRPFWPVGPAGRQADCSLISVQPSHTCLTVALRHTDPVLTNHAA